MKSLVPAASRSVRTNWVLSYALVLLVPVLVSLFVAFATHRVLRDQIQDSSNLVADLLRKEVEGRIAYVLRLVNDIGTDPLTSVAIEGPVNGEGEFRANLFDLSNALAVHGSYNRPDDFFFISLNTVQGVLLPRAYYTLPEFVQFHFQGTSTTAEELWKILNQRNDNATIPLDYIDSLGRQRSVIALLKSLPPHSDSIQATIGVFIDSERLIDSLRSLVDKSGLEVRIVGLDETILWSSLTQDKIGAKAPASTEPGIIHAGSSTLVLSARTISPVDWTLQVLTPEPYLLEKLWWVQAGTFAGMAISLGLGIWLTAYWLRKNYQPIRRILGELSNRTGLTEDQTGNEFTYIEQAIVQAFEDRYRAIERFEGHKGTLQENLVAKILQGAPDLEDFGTSSLMALEMDWANKACLVVLAEHDAADSQGRALRPPQFRDALAKLVGKRGLVWPAAGSDETLFVITTNAKDQTLLKDRLRTAPLPFIALSSAWFANWVQLPIGLTQVRAVRSYRYSAAGNRIQCFEDLPTHEATNSFPLDLRREEQFVNALAVGDSRTAEAIIDSLIAENLAGLSPSEAHFLINGIAAAFLKALPVTYLEAGERGQLMADLEAIAKLKTAAESLEGLKNLATAVCAMVQELMSKHHDQLRADSGQRLVDNVRRFLAERYSDSQISLTVVAEELGYSAAYLSRQFKDLEKESISNSLSRIRVEHAKDLLRSPDLTLAGVASQCGFVDINTFIRTFKKICGVTPGLFREKLQLGH